MCQDADLYQIDLLGGNKNRVIDREYWAQKKGSLALDTEATAQGETHIKLETDKEKLRHPQGMQRMVDINTKRAQGKGIDYERWATTFNLKQAVKTINIYTEYGFSSPVHQRNWMPRSLPPTLICRTAAIN